MNNILTRSLASLLLTLSVCCGSLHAQEDGIYNSIKLLSRTLLCIDNMYVDSVNCEQLAEVAVKAMLEKLDPHSSYLTPQEVRAMHEGLDGGFEGIGIRYQMENDTLLVINTVTGGPSEAVGLLPGDRIIMVGDSVIAGQHFSSTEIQRRLRGPKGSEVRLGIQREHESELLWFLVKRDKIPVYSVDAYYMATPTTGYIHISRFAQTTYDEANSAMEALLAEGMEDLVIDLQGNGGGYLNAAVELANLFIPSSETVVYTEGRTEGRKDYVTRSFVDRFYGRLVVLIDEQSASASEIFAGAIQDLDRGVIVGRRSFGKGLVQRPIELPNGGLIRLTVSHYYTPSGRCIQKPYTKGDQKSYHEDLLNRLNRGELLSADSIRLADSLRYTTRAGRTVYGGGGIMPDVFVPLDTTRVCRAHRAVLAKGSINRYIIQYFKENQAALHFRYASIEEFLDEESGFDLSDDIVLGVIEQARKDSAQCDSLESLLTNELFRTQILAYLANDLFENGAYTRIMNQTANVYCRGLEVIMDERKYTRYLLRSEE